MEKRNIFWVLITSGIAIVALLIAINLIFKKDTVNEGKFRVSDVILTSTAEITNKTNINNAWSIDLSQKNKLSLLITRAEGANVKSIRLTDITINKGNVILFEDGNESKINLSSEKQNLDIEKTFDSNNNMLIEIMALNENILKNWNIPEGTNEIIYDGRIFETAGMSLKDINFKLKFNLKITEDSGKVSILKVDLALPSEELIKNGADVRRLALDNFKFKVL